MSYKIQTIPNFLADAKKLSKKYPSFKNDLTDLGNNLIKNPTQGISLGKNCYKIRLPITSKNKGKSGGARIVTCVVKVEESIFLLSVFDKSEKENISDNEIKERLKEVDAALNPKK